MAAIQRRRLRRASDADDGDEEGPPEKHMAIFAWILYEKCPSGGAAADCPSEEWPCENCARFRGDLVYHAGRCCVCTHGLRPLKRYKSKDDKGMMRNALLFHTMHDSCRAHFARLYGEDPNPIPLFLPDTQVLKKGMTIARAIASGESLRFLNPPEAASVIAFLNRQSKKRSEKPPVQGGGGGGGAEKEKAPEEDDCEDEVYDNRGIRIPGERLRVTARTFRHMLDRQPDDEDASPEDGKDAKIADRTAAMVFPDEEEEEEEKPAKRKKKIIVSDEDESAVEKKQEPAAPSTPLCACGRRSVIRLCSKPAENEGRPFYGCPAWPSAECKWIGWTAARSPAKDCAACLYAGSVGPDSKLVPYKAEGAPYKFDGSVTRYTCYNHASACPMSCGHVTNRMDILRYGSCYTCHASGVLKRTVAAEKEKADRKRRAAEQQAEARKVHSEKEEKKRMADAAVAAKAALDNLVNQHHRELARQLKERDERLHAHKKRKHALARREVVIVDE